MDPATQQAIAQLVHQQVQQQTAAIQQQLQQAQQQLQQVQQAATQAAASPSPPLSGAPAASSKPLVKPRPPSTFNATGKPGELDQWEREMRYQFAAYGAALPNDAARIAHAVSYLGPVPLQWWDANPAHHTVNAWDAFVRLLRDRFRPVNAAKLARIEIFKIRQGASQTAGAHAARFQELLVSLPNMHEEDRIHLFVHSLTPALKRRIADKEYASLHAAINAAVQCEGLYGAQLATDDAAASSSSTMDINHIGYEDEDDDYEFEDRSSGPRTKQTARGGPASARPIVEQLAAMREQLYSIQTRDEDRGYRRRNREKDRIDDVDDATIKARLAGNVCLRCGSNSHWKSNCPNAPSRK